MGLLQRIKTGVVLTRESVSIMRTHPQLLLFPVVGGVAGLSFLGLVLVPMLGLVGVSSGDPPIAVLVAGLGLLYLGLAFISAFFAAALIHQTRAVIAGAEPSLRDGIAGAWSVKGPLFVWALISATVGVVLDLVSESSDSIAGQILSVVVGVAWTVLTFFVVPVIVFENPSVRGMFTSSGETFKETYGETPISLVVTTVVGLLCGAVLFVPGLGLLFGVGGAAGFVGILLAVAGVVVVSLVSSTIRGIVKTVLYFYAREGRRPDGFEEVFERLDYVDTDQSDPEQSRHGFGGVQ